jgi:predicted ATP-dependent protease
VAYGNRIAENKHKLSLRFGRILDMLKEAAFWATKDKETAVTGDQGVMIPSANVNNLMVKKAVQDAVHQGVFHIYQVSTIEQGIEVLTGVPAGRADDNFVFPECTVFGAVQAKLKRFHDRSVWCLG